MVIFLLLSITFIIFSIFLINYIQKRKINKKVYHNLKNPSLNQINKTNKIIWSYWHSQDKPVSVNVAIHSWIKQNPDFLICIINQKNINTYLDKSTFPSTFSKLSHAHQADVIRILLLEKYGGYWIDSTILLTKPILSQWQLEEKEDMGGYYADFFTTNMKYPVLENWFLCCPKNSTLATDWRKEFFRALEYKDASKYIEEIKKDTDLQDINRHTYLLMHCSLQKVLQSNKEYRLKIKPAGQENGPLQYLKERNWDSHKAVKYLLKNNMDTPVIKLRGPERDSLERFILLNKKDSTIDRIINS